MGLLRSLLARPFGAVRSATLRGAGFPPVHGLVFGEVRVLGAKKYGLGLFPIDVDLGVEDVARAAMFVGDPVPLDIVVSVSLIPDWTSNLTPICSYWPEAAKRRINYPQDPKNPKKLRCWENYKKWSTNKFEYAQKIVVDPEQEKFNRIG